MSGFITWRNIPPKFQLVNPGRAGECYDIHRVLCLLYNWEILWYDMVNKQILLHTFYCVHISDHSYSMICSCIINVMVGSNFRSLNV